MPLRLESRIIVICLLVATVGFLHAQTNQQGISLQKNKGYTNLLVDSKPFLVLGGELGNSTASNLEYLQPSWSTLQYMNLNTVLAPVYWELIEPEENKFDFSLVNGMILEARKHNLKLVLLWFGTWKNSMSCYAPLWMKKNPDKYPRTLDSLGRSHEIFSVFGKETLAADKKAFAALMRHIRETDNKEKTVILMQVENEIGMLTTAREFSKLADQQYHSKIPADLNAYLEKNKATLLPELKTKWEKQGYKTNDSWPNAFGAGLETEEMFQAWHYAKFANEVTAAGKKEYNIPMFVNAALPRPGKKPGQYPSAGPLPHLLEIWQLAAPSIDMLSPDFYNPDFTYWCDLYNRNGNILFVPEHQFDESCAAKAFYLIGHYKGLGFSPFSIENEKGVAAESLKKTYEVLKQMTPFITAKNWLAMDGFLVDKNNRFTTVIMGNYELTVSHDNTLGWSPEAKDSVWKHKGGLILQTGTDEFMVSGTGIVVTFKNTNTGLVTNIAEANEVSYKEGKEIKGRRMNGDQDHQGRHIRFAGNEWGIQKVTLYNSPEKINY